MSVKRPKNLKRWRYAGIWELIQERRVRRYRNLPALVTPLHLRRLHFANLVRRKR